MIRQLLAKQRDFNKTAVIDDNLEYSYGDLLERARALRPFLPIESGGLVAVLLPNSVDFIVAFWGTVMSGLTVFPLNVLMTANEVEDILTQASVKTLITSTSFTHLFVEKNGEIGNDIAAKWSPFNIVYINQISTVITDKHLKNSKANTLGQNEINGTDKLNIDSENTDTDPDMPMVLLNTSGTTGMAKIVQLSERNIETSLLGYLAKLHFGTSTRYTLAVPFSSVYGVMILSACLLRSFPLVLLNGAFTLDLFYKAVEKHRITHYEGSATAVFLMEKMAGRATGYNIDTLKYVGFGGSKVSGKTVEKLLAAYSGKEFYQGYGMTEAAPMITKHPQKKLVKTASVGSAIDGVEVAVEKDGQLVKKPYAEGEIVARGANIMLGYLDNPTATSKVIKNGYLYTGDIGYLDEDGYLYISGRKKNMIIVRGFKVYPEEVEECIHNSGLCVDCFVYSEIDDNGNECVCADVIPACPSVSGEQIRDYCAARLSEYKQPHKIRLCESISKNATGKTIRQKHQA